MSSSEVNSPSRPLMARPSSVAARGKRSRDLSSSSQRQSKRRSVPATGHTTSATVSSPALQSEPLPVPARPPAPSSEEGDEEAAVKEATEQLDSGDGDDDWGSVTVEEDTEQSQSQDEEQPASSQPQHSSYPSPAVSGAQSRQTETAPAASASSDSSHASLDSDATLQSVGSTTATSTSTSKLGHPDKAVASRMALMRLQSDLKALEHDPPEGISASPVDPSNPLVWRACIFGPSDTPWEGGVFQLQLVFPKEYPQKAPQVRFLSKLFHPNVFADGNICLDILAEKWSPIYTVSSLLSSIQSLLTDPNTASPANPEAARLFANDIKEYRKRVRQCAAKATM